MDNIYNQGTAQWRKWLTYWVNTLKSNIEDNTTNKQNSLIVDGTGIKVPTVDAVNGGLLNKVDKVTSKSLILDTEISRLAGVSNVDISGKEDKVTGSSLITSAKLALIDTNASNIAGLGNGSPKGSYADLAALIAANPDHAFNYLTLDNGYWNYYNGSAFVGGGVYLGVGDVVSALPQTLTGDQQTQIGRNTGLALKNDVVGITNKAGQYNELIPDLIAGYIDYNNGNFNGYSPGNAFNCDIHYYEITTGVQNKYNGVLAADAGIAFYDVDKVYISGINVMPGDGILVFPEGAMFYRLSDWKSGGVHTGVKLVISSIGTLDTEIGDLIDRVGTSEKNIPLTLIAGYINYTTGSFDGYSPGDVFNCDVTYFEIEAGAQYKYTGELAAEDGNAGIAFYDEDKVYISGINATPEDGILVFPADTVYFRLSDRKYNGVHTGILLSKKIPGLILPMIEDLQKNVMINCTGDSTTQGMGVAGVNTADYGQAPYPARLFTILTDNGYTIPVNNYGHGGECTPDICARLGGIAAYITEDITIPADGSGGSLGTAVITDGRVSGTKIAIFDADDDDVDFNVFFTQLSSDTNPIYIDGIPYSLYIEGNSMKLYKENPDGIETTIKAGSLVFTNDNRNGAINIIEAGINDYLSLTLDKYISRMLKCGQVNGGKYIIIGCTHLIWNDWADVIGIDNAAKYAYYLRKCREAFGIHFLDLRDLFYRHAVDYALAAGYLSDLTSGEIIAVRANMTNKVMDGAFTYDGSTNNVHLNEAGYHVIGLLLFDLLKRLNYI